MSEKEALERALQIEQRMLQRQKLFKRLWRLNQSDQSTRRALPTTEESKYEDLAREHV